MHNRLDVIFKEREIIGLDITILAIALSLGNTVLQIGKYI